MSAPGTPRAPLTWTGYAWGAERADCVLMFTDADCRLWRASVATALQLALLDAETSTPERRDFLRRWACAVAEGRPWPAFESIELELDAMGRGCDRGARAAPYCKP